MPFIDRVKFSTDTTTNLDDQAGHGCGCGSVHNQQDCGAQHGVEQVAIKPLAGQWSAPGARKTGQIDDGV